MNRPIKCTIHLQEPLDLVCLAASCEHRGLICYLCKLDEHVEHQPIQSLKIFLGQLLDKQANSQQFIKETSLIDQEILNIQKVITKIKKKMSNPQLVNEAFHTFWRQNLTSIAKFDEIIAELKQILEKGGQSIIKELNDWIKINGDKYISQQPEEGQPKDNIYLSFLKNKHKNLQSIRQQLQKFQNKNNFQDVQILSYFSINTITRSFKLRFSEELKGTCMLITSPTKAQMNTSGNQRMMLLEPHLGLNRSIKKWKVKIQKLSSWIGVGVGHLDTIKAVNFDFSYTSPNHGNYLVSSNGYSWNGYKMQNNSKYETFLFTTGDIIQVNYDPVNNKVTFKKQGNESVFTYDIDPNQKPIHAAINLTGIGDAVQIIL